MAKGKFIENTLKRSDKKNGITLVLTCSKKNYFSFFFEGLKRMDLPKKDMHLLIYDNTNDLDVLEKIKEETKHFSSFFRSVRIYKSYLSPKGILAASGNERFTDSKLSNIWSMWKNIKNMIYTDTFFQLEDDTLCPPDSFQRLHRLLMSDSKAGFVTAVETGRTQLPYARTRLGVHKVDVRKGWLFKRDSFPPETKGVHEIDAAGVYCFAARTEAWKTGFIDYKPITKIFSIFAMDNVLVYNVKMHGWKVLCDFDIWCGHMQKTPTKMMIFTPKQAVHAVDLWLPEINNYAINIEVKEKNQKRRKVRVKEPAETIELHPVKDSPSEKQLQEKIKKIKELDRKKKKNKSQKNKK